MFFRDHKHFSIVVTKNATVDAKIKSQIDEAISAIQNISGTFTSAVTSQSPTVTNAQNKVRALQTTLESELKPVIDGL